MLSKFVKDRAHNRHKAYCCDDIDPRLEALEAAVAALVAGTVPDGSVTLAKLAADAMTYAREINKGTLICEWIGTQEEYEQHLSEVGGSPLPNVRYSITNGNPPAEVSKFDEMSALPVGTIVAVRVFIGEEAASLYRVGNKITSLYYAPEANYFFTYPHSHMSDLRETRGVFVCCGSCATEEESDSLYQNCLYQKIANIE